MRNDGDLLRQPLLDLEMRVTPLSNVDDPNTHSLCFPLRHFSVVGMGQYEMWLRDLLFIQKCSSLWDRTEIPNYDILIDILESLIKVSQQ